MKIKFITSLLLLFIFASCSDNKPEVKEIEKNSNTAKISTERIIERWYTNEQVANGKVSFENICASCHKKDASGTVDWKTKVNGSYPPPPLNGNAHAWHHPLSALHFTIKEGTMKNGGNMPGWGAMLSDDQIYETIAFFQSKWNDEIYSAWLQRNN